MCRFNISYFAYCGHYVERSVTACDNYILKRQDKYCRNTITNTSSGDITDVCPDCEAQRLKSQHGTFKSKKAGPRIPIKRAYPKENYREPNFIDFVPVLTQIEESPFTAEMQQAKEASYVEYGRKSAEKYGWHKKTPDPNSMEPQWLEDTGLTPGGVVLNPNDPWLRQLAEWDSDKEPSAQPEKKPTRKSKPGTSADKAKAEGASPPGSVSSSWVMKAGSPKITDEDWELVDSDVEGSGVFVRKPQAEKDKGKAKSSSKGESTSRRK